MGIHSWSLTKDLFNFSTQLINSPISIFFLLYQDVLYTTQMEEMCQIHNTNVAHVSLAKLINILKNHVS